VRCLSTLLVTPCADLRCDRITTATFRPFLPPFSTFFQSPSMQRSGKEPLHRLFRVRLCESSERCSASYGVVQNHAVLAFVDPFLSEVRRE
jgi:hypothetical protein